MKDYLQNTINEHAELLAEHGLAALPVLLSALSPAKDERYASEHLGEYLIVLPNLETRLTDDGEMLAQWTFFIAGRESGEAKAVMRIGAVVTGSLFAFGELAALLEFALNPRATLRPQVVAALDDRSEEIAEDNGEEVLFGCQWCEQAFDSLAGAQAHQQAEHVGEELLRVGLAEREEHDAEGGA